MMFDVTHGRSARIQTNDHVIEVGKSAAALGNHTRHIGACSISRDTDINWSVCRVHGFGIGAVTAVGLAGSFFSSPVAIGVAQVCIHFRAEPTVNRGLQQATHQLVGVGG